VSNAALGKVAWDCSADEMAREVWRQIHRDLLGIDPVAVRKQKLQPVVPMPAWFHIDRHLILGERDPVAGRPVIANTAPYLIPLVGDWKHRPGNEPWDPGSARTTVNLPQTKVIWTAVHGGYPVHFDKLVFAGTYLRTFTRMTTMEAANESGRHAVNAILDRAVSAIGERLELRDMEATGDSLARARRSRANDITSLFEGREGEPIYLPTRLGDYAKIWNPEDNEPNRFRALRDDPGRSGVAAD
jgi:hypothetical protein